MKTIICMTLIFISFNSYSHECEPKTNREAKLLDLSYSEITEDFKKLVGQGVNPNICDPFKSTPLSIAAFWNQALMVRFLVEHPKTDVNFADQYGWPPLAHAAARGNIEIVKILLNSSKLKIDQKISNGNNIFHINAYNEPSSLDLEILKLLLTKATPSLLNKKSDRGLTPLHFAIRRNKLLTVKTLLESKMIDLSLTTSTGANYVDFALEEGRPEIAQTLQEAIVNCQSLVP